MQNGSRAVFLFGKVWDEAQKKYSSVGIQVKNMERIMYAVPRERGSDCSEVLEEFQELFRTKYHKVKNWRARPIEKNYSFEMPFSSGNFLEVRMSADYPPLPEDIKGKTFEHVMGTNTSILESFII